MPRRPQKNTKRAPKRRSREKRTREYASIPFQGAPVRRGEEIDIVIDDIGSQGDGISRIQGYPIFVPRAKIGERLKVKIVSVGRKFAMAEKIA